MFIVKVKKLIDKYFDIDKIENKVAILKNRENRKRKTTTNKYKSANNNCKNTKLEEISIKKKNIVSKNNKIAFKQLIKKA